KNIILKSYCNLISTVLKYVIYVIAVLVILKIYGLTLTTILASAGFIGVMITYIFQDLIKDVTNGFFIVFSTPFEVGDNIKVNDFVGQVREITSRYIVLVDAQGDKCIVNNRAIDQVIVYNKGINFKKRVK
ncbi:MAG: mechanosensitive ion channel, partial [Erysipelotrichales bacterium]